MADVLDNLKVGVTALIMIALIGAALGIGLNEFQADIGESQCAKLTTTTTYNETGRVCYEAANTSNTASITAASWNSTDNGLVGLSNSTGYLDTIGTLLGVGALIAVVVGAFFAFRRFD